MLFTLLLILILSVFVLFWQLSLLVATIIGSPIVYASPKAIRDGWKLAELSPGRTIIDLGCGNARSLILAAAEFGAKGIGIDRSVYSYWSSKVNVWIHGQARNVTIVQGDFHKLEEKLATSDVVYLYLLNETLAQIEPWLFQHIGTKTVVVSLAFSFPNHQPTKTCETMNLGRKTKIRLYRLEA
ncbi:MAG: methyltransferase domain-containing protein [Patescibacteria group bacterium]